MKILVLCHGNINRSPLCAAVLAEWFEVRSAALKPNARGRATRKMREAALDRGYNLDEHRTHEVTREDLEWADRVIYMDQGNYKRLVQRLDVEGLEVDRSCLAAWTQPLQERIPDPNFYRGSSPEFQAVVDMIIQASKNFAAMVYTADPEQQ